MDEQILLVPFSGGTTVNDMIRRHPATVEVFRRYGIDSCCGGALAVSAAAERHGVDPALLWSALREVVG